MSPSADRLTGPLTKTKRAHHHVQKLATLIQTFFNTNPYRISPQDDPQTGDQVFYVDVFGHPDPDWGAIAGDIVHNLRSALDLLMWQLVEANNSQPSNLTEFPIFNERSFFENPKKYEASVQRKVDGASQGAIDLIESVQPYNAGYEPLWIVHRLDIVDKHHVLLTVGAAHRFVDVGEDVIARLRGLMGQDIPTISLGIVPADQLFPLDRRQEVYRVLANARDPEGKANPKFGFEIAFGDDDVVKGEPMLPTLSNLVQFVTSLIETFGPWL